MLALRGLQAGYGGKAIVEIPDFSLATGEHCLILGNSGTGKTTLLYALAGLLTPLAGEVEIQGETITRMRPKTLDLFRGKHIGIIYQTLHMLAPLTVLENILLASYASGVAQDKTRALELLAQLGIAELRDKKPAALSQGQLQRVAIARAAMNRPALILGDEPTSALDDQACERVMQLLLSMAAESGASLVIATHDARIRPYFTRTISLGGVA